MRIVVTGASGLIGRALVRGGAIGLTHRDLDITDGDAVRAAMARLQPDAVVNCAVIGVDVCETNPALARAINVDGPRNLARSAPRVVHFSTNYVLDPVNVYGQTKLEGERVVLDASPSSLVVRTSWVFGAGKESFLATAPAKLARGERIAAITDTWASTTFVEDLVSRLMEVFDQRGVISIVNEGVLTYLDFALEAARLVGADPSLIDRITEKDMKRAAPRPPYTPMTAEPPLRPWRAALADYVRRG